MTVVSQFFNELSSLYFQYTGLDENQFSYPQISSVRYAPNEILLIDDLDLVPVVLHEVDVVDVHEGAHITQQEIFFLKSIPSEYFLQV